MATYVLRRTAAAIPVLLVVAVTTFFITNLTPGDPVRLMVGDFATEAEVAAMRSSLGLDQPLPLRFVEWMTRLMRGDLGRSLFLEMPVTQAILNRTEPTILLALLGQLLGAAFGIPMGVLAAVHHRRLVDFGAIGAALIGISIPSFLVGTLLVSVFSVGLRWFPVAGYTPVAEIGLGVLRYLALPAMTLGLMQSALLARMTRSAVLEILPQDYIRTAKAKGLARRLVLYKHVLRNAAIPIVTVFGLSLAGLLAGTWVVEAVFAIPGTGSLAITAILRRDYPVIQGSVIFVAGIYLAINFLIDISYAWLDPRLRER